MGNGDQQFLSDLKPEDQMEESDKFMAILIPGQIEKELDRSDRIDDKIDRTIKRLLQVRLAKQISRNTRMQADVSVSPAEAVDEPECPQEPPIIDETEQRGEIAPPAKTSQST
jgi:hypothetical protein